jgi:hypothetical protein
MSTSLDQRLAKDLGAMPDHGLLSAATLKRHLGLVTLGLPIAGTGVRIYESPHGRVVDATGTTSQGGGSGSPSQAARERMEKLPADARALVSCVTLKQCLVPVVAALPVAGTGMRVSESPHGRVIDAGPGGGSTPLNLDLERRLQKLPDGRGSLVGVRTYKALMRGIALGLPVAGTGVRISETPHGRVISLEGVPAVVCIEPVVEAFTCAVNEVPFDNEEFLLLATGDNLIFDVTVPGATSYIYSFASTADPDYDPPVQEPGQLESSFAWQVPFFADGEPSTVEYVVTVTAFNDCGEWVEQSWVLTVQGTPP